MKKIYLTFIQRDSLLFKALIRKALPVPEKGQFYFNVIQLNDTKEVEFVVFLSPEYYIILLKKLEELESSGKFGETSAKDEWKNIINAFINCETINELNLDNLREWQ